jgi:hypothetical protein
MVIFLMWVVFRPGFCSCSRPNRGHHPHPWQVIDCTYRPGLCVYFVLSGSLGLEERSDYLRSFSVGGQMICCSLDLPVLQPRTNHIHQATFKLVNLRHSDVFCEVFRRGTGCSMHIRTANSVSSMVFSTFSTIIGNCFLPFPRENQNAY